MENLVTKEQHASIRKRICPDCGGKLKEGACGGHSVNVYCLNCSAAFNDMWVFGSERIGKMVETKKIEESIKKEVKKMPESETSKKIREVIKLADKFVQDVTKDIKALRKAAKELEGEKKEE